MFLECISGKDRSLKVPVGREPIRMGDIGLQPTIPLRGLEEKDGYMVFWAVDGSIDFDGRNLHIPAYVNNQEVRTARLRGNDVLRLKDTVWKVMVDGKAGQGFGIRTQFSQLIGLEELQDFRLGNIFSEVFKRHSREEMEEQLIMGTARHTPTLAEIETGWAKPWLFARLLGISAVLAFCLYAGFEAFENLNLVPGLIFVGSFAVPASALIFFLEMNVPRNVSLFSVMGMVFIGGVASLIASLILYSKLTLSNSWFLALAAGPVEETAKLVIVILLAGKATRYPWILNGLLLGAAVGTGFAAFESSGYALNYMLSDGFQVGVHEIVLRGVLAPFGHIVWTANAAAALWMVKGDKPFSWNMVQAPAFLRIFVASVLCHIIWDAPFTILTLPFVLDLKYLLLGVIAWIICFRLVQAGLKQLNEARAALKPSL